MYRRTTTALFAAVLLSPLFAAPVMAQSTDPNIARIQHIIDCATWLISDPAKHAANCLPSHVTQDQINAMMQPGLVLTGGTTDSCEEVPKGSRVAFGESEEDDCPPDPCEEWEWEWDRG